MATRKFKVGDTVRLRSGGPLMTVASVSADLKGTPTVGTVWFDKNDRECHGGYLEDLLEADDGYQPYDPGSEMSGDPY